MDIKLEIELIRLINSFQNTITLNNLLVKEKILRKLNMISNLRYYGFPIMNYPLETGNKIIDQLNAIDKTGDIVQYRDKTNNANKLLGDILHNAYQNSGYNILLSNIPQFGQTVNNQESILIDSEVIYDTLEQYAVANVPIVESVVQISSDIYLAKVKDLNIAKQLCLLLNNKLIIQQIIKVEYIESSLIMNHIDDIDDINIDGSVEDNKSPKQKNKIYNWFNYVISKIISAFKIF
jgi:hypothetical protein